MAKVAVEEIKDEGFFQEMFGVKDPESFDPFVSRAIDGQTAVLTSRIGADLYATSDPTQAEYVKQAEKQLTVAEMWRRRIARKLGQAQGDNLSCKYEAEARDQAAEQAEGWIFKLIGGDFASGISESSHFDGDA